MFRRFAVAMCTPWSHSFILKAILRKFRVHKDLHTLPPEARSADFKHSRACTVASSDRSIMLTESGLVK